MSSRRIAAVGSLSLALTIGASVSCSTVHVDPADGGGGAAADDGEGGTRPDGGAGGGGDPWAGWETCQGLAWAGDPVYVTSTVGSTARRPTLVQTGGSSWALAFEADDGGGGRVIASLAVDDPFGAAWPPAIGAADAHFPTLLDAAFAEGDPGHLAFVVADGGGNVVLGETAPGANGSTVVTWSGEAMPMRFLARSAAGSYLVGSGDAGMLVVHEVAGHVPDPPVSPPAIIACAAPIAPAAAAARQDGGFLVAFSSPTSAPGCLDGPPPGPATWVHVATVDAGAATVGNTWEVMGGNLHDVVMVPSAEGGARLGVQSGEPGGLEVHPIVPDGAVDFANVSFVSSDYTSPASRFAIVDVAWAYAAVELVGNEVIPGGDLILSVMDDWSADQLSAAALGPQPTGRPSIVASDDRKSFLIAFEDTGQGPGTLGLLRADCATAE